MIELSNGHELEFLCASGALAFDGRGWPWEHPLRWLRLLDPKQFTVVVKSLTRHLRRGNLRLYNPWGCIRLIPGGAVNAVGLTNPGIEWWIRTCYPRMIRHGISPIVSIYPESNHEAEEMVRMLAPLNIVAIELNASCPNTEKDLSSNRETIVDYALTTCRNSSHPLIVKLGYTQDYIGIARELESVADAFHVINTVPWKVVFPDKPSPLEHLGGGGVSGKSIHQFALETVGNLRQTVATPIIGGGGIESIDEVLAFGEAGASAFSIGTSFLLRPLRPNRIVDEFHHLVKTC